MKNRERQFGGAAALLLLLVFILMVCCIATENQPVDIQAEITNNGMIALDLYWIPPSEEDGAIPKMQEELLGTIPEFTESRITGEMGQIFILASPSDRKYFRLGPENMSISVDAAPDGSLRLVGAEEFKGDFGHKVPSMSNGVYFADDDASAGEYDNQNQFQNDEEQTLLHTSALISIASQTICDENPALSDESGVVHYLLTGGVDGRAAAVRCGTTSTTTTASSSKESHNVYGKPYVDLNTFEQLQKLGPSFHLCLDKAAVESIGEEGHRSGLRQFLERVQEQGTESANFFVVRTVEDAKFDAQPTFRSVTLSSGSYEASFPPTSVTILRLGPDGAHVKLQNGALVVAEIPNLVPNTAVHLHDLLGYQALSASGAGQVLVVESYSLPKPWMDYAPSYFDAGKYGKAYQDDLAPLPVAGEGAQDHEFVIDAAHGSADFLSP